MKKDINHSTIYGKGIFGMKTKNKELTKRIIATMLSLIMVVGLLPFSAFAADNDATIESSLGDFFDPTKKGDVPEQFNMAGDPYGEDGYFNLAPQNELMKIFVGGSRDSTNNDGYITDGFQLGKTRIDDYSNAGNLIAHVENPVEAWSYLQVVPFDPAGTGRDTHIAYVGYVPDSKMIRVGVYDAVNRKAADSTRWVADATWIAEADGYSLMQFSAYNFMSITAGDYNGDGKETIVIFSSGDGKTATLSEWYFSPSANYIYQQATSSSLLNEDYIQMGDTTEAGQKIGGDLTTGDFDGDGIDDLAVVSYIGIEASYEVDDSLEDFAPYLAVALGRGKGDHIVNKTSHNLTVPYYEAESNGVFDTAYKQDGSFSHHVFPAAPSVAAGNMDNDPEDELVIAGYSAQFRDANSQINLGGAILAIDGVHIFSYNISDTAIKRFSSVTNTINQWTSSVSSKLGGSIKTQGELENLLGLGSFGLKGTYFSFPQVGIEFVKTNGAAAPEELFVNGSFMKYSVNNDTWTSQYQDGYFTNNISGIQEWKANIGFITNVSVGVFNDNLLGREQVAYTVWIKDGESSNLIGTTDNADDYSVFSGISGGAYYSDSGTSYGTVSGYESSGLYDVNNGYDRNSDQEFHNNNFDCGDKRNLIFVAVDIDNDGVLAKYADKDYAYSDPTVITVLQASPYYGAFGYLDKCETSYTFETSFIVGQTTSNSTSFSIGASIEVEAPVIKSSIRSGYSGGWDESFTSEFETTYSTTFTATKDNVVVLQRTPVILYKYLVQKSDGTWSSATDNNGNFVTISVPCEPVYALVTVEEYNAFVTSTAYKNTIQSNRLSAITMDELIDNAGDPADYFGEWPSGATNLSASTYSASSGTGSITSAYSTSGSDTIEQSTTQGFYFGETVSVGYSSPIGFGAWAGVEFETEGSTTQGSFTTTVSSTTVSGTVGNLGESGLPAAMLENYLFNWQFGSWKMNLGSNANIYAYGYRVMNAKSVDQITNLKVADGDDDAESAVLSWDAVNDATEYTIYTYENGEYTEIATTLDNTYTYVIPSNSRQYEYTFAVTFTRDGTVSIYSDLVTYYRQSYGMSAYELALQEGFEGTLQEWLESLIGADGKDGVGVKTFSYNNAGELLAILTDNTIINLGVIAGEDGENGLTPYVDENGNWWIGEVDTGVKATGTDGKDGITPQLRINTETNEWEVSLDNGDAWRSTGVVATGAKGEKGDKGDKGDTGLGIKEITIDHDGNLIITFTDDTTENLGKVIGKDGADGSDGADGLDGVDGKDGVDGLDGADGKDGVGVKSAALDQNGNLIITLTDDTVFNLGVIVGTDGKNGTDGKDGKDGVNGKDGKDGINGKDGENGKDGANGKDGIDGKDGLGIADIKIDENGNFIFTMSDGSTINAGSVPKDDSVQAIAGVNEGGITQRDVNNVKTLATVATILSSISLLWNVISLFVLNAKKKR